MALLKFSEVSTRFVDIGGKRILIRVVEVVIAAFSDVNLSGSERQVGFGIAEADCTDLLNREQQLAEFDAREAHSTVLRTRSCDAGREAARC